MYSDSQKKWISQDQLDIGEATLAEMLPFIEPPRLL